MDCGADRNRGADGTHARTISATRAPYTARRLRMLEIEEARTSSLFANSAIAAPGSQMRISAWRASACTSERRSRSMGTLNCYCGSCNLWRGMAFVCRLRRNSGSRRISRPSGSTSAPPGPSGRPSARYSLFRTPRLALRAAHETGVLRAVFPEMERIDCLVLRDFYHRYTVDEHTLVAIQTIAQLRGSKDAAALSYASLLSEIGEPGLLSFALLFHDTGKGTPDTNHVDSSLGIAEQAMERIQMPVSERESVRFLIRCHLEMSSTMSTRDPFDPSTAEYLAHKVGTVENLKSLTLLSYADMSAVNPTVMTDWRAEQLWQLYLLTYNELTRELENERITPADSPERSAFLEGFPTRYLRTHSETEIDRHIKLETENRANGVAVEIEKSGSAYRLTLLTGDRPFLFASVAGALSSFGMNIFKAEAFANRRGTVLDTFSFSDPLRTLELNPSEVERLKSTVARAAQGRADVKQLLRSRPRVKPPSRKARIEPSVHMDDQASRWRR